MSLNSIDRREFLASGLALAGATLLGVSACSPEDGVAPSPPTASDADPSGTVALEGDLFEPRVLSSLGGILTADIACSTRPVKVAGRQVLQPVTYNGAFPGPTLWVRPGDMVDIRFTNKIVFDQADTKPGYGRPPRPSNMTNLHYHGMHLPPTGTADNMLVSVPAYGTYRYLFQVPHDHPAGLFWYHAHVHGLVTNQVSRGAAGMIYVANAYSDAITRMGIRRRLMALQQVYLEPGRKSTLISDDGERDDADLALSVINGQLMPEIRMRPGEPQVWSLLNGSSSAFYMLRLEGHTFDVVADDGIALRAPGRLHQRTLLMASAKRLEVVVRASTNPGRYELSYDEYNQGVDTWPQKVIATVVVEGEPWTGPDHPGVDSSTSLADLSLLPVDPARQRTIVFGTNLGVPEGVFGRFTINGHAWNPAYSEWTSTLGTVEEWLVLNETDQDHPLHVHVNPVQITKINGSAVPFDGYQDTVIVPRFGSVTLRTRFTDFVGGPILLHCHILDHEDMGMMMRFEIAPAPVT